MASRAKRSVAEPWGRRIGAGRVVGRGLAWRPAAAPSSDGRVTTVKGGAAQDPSSLRRLVAPWSEAWSLAGLEHRINITFSSRFRTSLGRCVPRAGEIRLAAFLLTGPPAVLREALCHEVAHAAVYELHGIGAKPHGSEWRALMETAGFVPRTRLPANLVPDVLLHRGNPKRLWEHRCPVCHASRMARRRVTRWRCAACRAAGLEGGLTITELHSPTGMRP